jgi:hypothetical protein
MRIDFASRSVLTFIDGFVSFHAGQVNEFAQMLAGNDYAL